MKPPHCATAVGQLCPSCARGIGGQRARAAHAQGIRSDALIASGVIWDGAGVEINPHLSSTGEGIQGLAVCVPESLHL